jgi:hypothetical protein
MNNLSCSKIAPEIIVNAYKIEVHKHVTLDNSAWKIKHTNTQMAA